MKLSRLFLALLVATPMLATAAQTFTSTADGKTMDIPSATFDTPAAKEFLNSGKNIYIGDQAAAKAGKKIYQLYSCAQCHGPVGNGQVGPNLRDDGWNYAKNSTDKGFFETLWGGTPAGMGAKGKGLMLADDPTQGLTPDEVLKVAAFLRTKIEAAPAAAPEAAKEAVPAEAAAVVGAAAATAAATVKETAKKPVKKAKAKAKKVKAS